MPRRPAFLVAAARRLVLGAGPLGTRHAVGRRAGPVGLRHGEAGVPGQNRQAACGRPRYCSCAWGSTSGSATRSHRRDARASLLCRISLQTLPT